MLLGSLITAVQKRFPNFRFMTEVTKFAKQTNL